MDLRVYARAKEIYDEETKKPISERTNMANPAIDRVSVMTFEIAKDRMREAEEREEDPSV